MSISTHDIKTASWAPVLILLALLFSGCVGDDGRPAGTPVSAVKILVDDGGLYRVTEEELRRAGMSVSELSSSNVNLLEAGHQIPFMVAEGSLLFYGEEPTSRYARYRPYILRSGESGLPISQKATAPSTAGTAQLTRQIHLEENYQYVSDARTADEEEPWFWQTVQVQAEVPLSFSLSGVGTGAGQLTIALYGSSHNPAVDPDHSLQLMLNEKPLSQVAWDGQTLVTRTLDLPEGSLQEGSNTLTMRNLPEEYLDIMRLDSVTIEFDSGPTVKEDYITFWSGSGEVVLRGFSAEPVILDLSDPRAPAQLIGWRYEGGAAHMALEKGGPLVASAPSGFRSPAEIQPLRSGRWRSPRMQADLIIVTTDALAPALEPLVKAREEQGLSVVVVPVVEIYDTFGHGAATPESINQFLRYAYEKWQEPQPRYLLLVGEATTDFRGYLADRPQNPIAGPENVIPPYLVPVNFSGETVSDARLADVGGDVVPEIAVGRWPVDSLREARDLVERTLRYENSQAPDSSIFVADGSSSEFLTVTERVLEKSGFPADKAQIMNGPTSGELAGTWNDGSWLVTYTGHGSLELWGKDDVFSVQAANGLQAAGASPIVLQLTCLSGLFAHPEITSLSEVMLSQPEGPVLVVGATSLTLSAHQEPFAIALLQSLQDPSVERIGDALQSAKSSLNVESTGLREISDTFGLLGDPSALIVRPQS